MKKTLLYLQRCHDKRAAFLRKLRSIIEDRGSSNLVYVDESGFTRSSYRRYVWGLRGKRVYGERDSQSRPRKSLIAGKRGKELLAPVLFEGSTNALWFNCWLEELLFKELAPFSTIIMDNAAFHNKKQVEEIAKKAGNYVLFLPPYSPDFNPIEKTFAQLKKRREHAPLGTTLDEIVMSYKNYWNSYKLFDRNN